MTAPTDLRVEYESDPVAIGTREPRFSWRVETDRRGVAQTAYRVLVARSRDALATGRGELWDSGRVESDRAANVEYDGTPLESDARYYWTVRVWDENGEASEWADPAAFATGPDPGDWAGEWIGHQPGSGDSNGWRSRWRPGDFDGEEWIAVDLGERRAIDAIELHPAEPFDGPETPDGMVVSPLYGAGEDADLDELPGFGFPSRYRVEVADAPDFADAATVATREPGEPATEPVRIDAGTSGRFVRVVATDLYEFDPANPPERSPHLKPAHVREEYRAWQVFALAALVVRDSVGEDLAFGGRVRASSSAETATWGREHLVDEHHESTTASTSPRLRSGFDLEKPVESARAHVCALGYGDLYLNGERVGDDELGPWTEYDERCPYATYEVGEHLREGENAIGLWLGRGWFSKGVVGWTGFGSPRAILDLRIEYEDGTTRTVSTDADWRASASPIVANDIYDGERYDARREQPGWSEPGFDDADWEGATIMSAPGGELVPERGPPMRVTETIEPEDVWEDGEETIVDFGQNLTGWVRLRIDDPEEGEVVTIHHAETLLEDGSLNTIDLRTAEATDAYVARGDDEEVYRPRFTYHGFRYAGITGYPGDLAPGDVEAEVVHTDLDPAGEFDCSEEELASVRENARWGLRGNAHSIPTDCPQRDERFGWTGDAHIATRAMCYEFDAVRFHEKWQADHDATQSRHGYLPATVPHGHGGLPADPTWTITRVTLPWHLYRHYGDRGVLEDHYEAMRRYVDYWHEESDGGLLGAEYGDYGDWLAFENADGRRGLPFELFNTAFHYHVTSLFARIAGVLEREADAEAYRERAGEIREAFHEAFFDPESATYGPGTQSSYAVPLFVGLVPGDREEEVAAGLAEKVRDDGGKLRTGFLGTRPLIHVLAEYGYEDLAFEVVSQPERPGWVYMVREGATTMWERWDSNTRIGDGMNSFNHSPFAFVAEWFYSTLAGIDFDPSIVEGIEVAPAVVGGLDWAEGAVETPHGEVASRWERAEGGLDLSVTVPWNTAAAIRIPVGASAEVREAGEVVRTDATKGDLPDGIEGASREGETIVLDLGAGAYEFEVR